MGGMVSGLSHFPGQPDGHASPVAPAAAWPLAAVPGAAADHATRFGKQHAFALQVG